MTPLKFGIASIYLFVVFGRGDSAVAGQENVQLLNVEYFGRAKFNCNRTINHTVNFVHLWILPSGELLRIPFQNQDAKDHIVVKDEGLVLVIDRIDDNDFGFYYCVANFGGNETDVVKFGVNINGPYYGQKYADDLKNNAIMGGIAAGASLAVMIIIWVLCANCKQAPRQGLHPPGIENEGFEFQKEINRITNADNSDTGAITKLEDSVYYMADGVESRIGGIVVDVVIEKQADPIDSMSTTDSGHYHSINSLGRDASLPNEDELEKIDCSSTKTPRRLEGDEIPNNNMFAEKLDDAFESFQGNVNGDDLQDTETETNLEINNPQEKQTDVSALYATPMKRNRLEDTELDSGTRTDQKRKTIESDNPLDIPNDIDSDNFDRRQAEHPTINGTNEKRIASEAEEMNRTDATTFETTEPDPKTELFDVDGQTVVKFNKVLASLPNTHIENGTVHTAKGNPIDEDNSKVADVRF